MSINTQGNSPANHAVRYHRYGEPAEVLQVEEVSALTTAPDEVLVRTNLVPVHRGDILAITGSPAFGSAPPLPAEGAIPGLEGLGVIEQVGADVNTFRVGQRVAIFPVSGSWRTHVVVKPAAIAAVPDEVPDALAARLLIDVATASLIVRRALAEQPRPTRVLQSGAGSGVGKIVSALLVEAGVEPVRLAHSEASAVSLARIQPDAPVVATAAEGWRAQLDAILDKSAPTVATDGVGGDLLGEVGARLAEGGLIVQYGTLGGTHADIRPIVPRRLRIEGLSVGTWPSLPEATRAGDVAAAFGLARERPALFGEAVIFALADLADAMKAMDAADRQGAILISFSGEA